MLYQIKCIQTIFGEEREQRLKLAFDIILSLGAQKPGASGSHFNDQNSEIRLVTELTDETGGESKENENMLLNSEAKL